MQSTLRSNHLTSLADLAPRELHAILDTARDIKRRVKAGDYGSVSSRLRGKVITLTFQKPSLRTRASFEIGVRRLGGSSIYLAPNDIGLGSRERVSDVARVLGSYGDAIVARVFEHDVIREMAEYAGVPVINALSDTFHPCQALADLLTLSEYFERLDGLTLAYIGAGNNVCHSLLLATALTNMELRVACPPEYKPDMQVLEKANEISIGPASRLITDDPRKAVHGADAVYTDVWASMGEENEADERRNAFEDYQVNDELLRAADRDDARLFGRQLPLVLHCLPAHYGDEITSDVVEDHPEIFEQAENRLYAQAGLLCLLL